MVGRGCGGDKHRGCLCGEGEVCGGLRVCGLVWLKRQAIFAASAPPQPKAMLRRPPTAIKLTQDDIALYEDAKKERDRAVAIAAGLQQQQQHQQHQPQQQQQQEANPYDGKAEGGRKGGRSREDRIGISGLEGGRR
ncbi:hypothetical protein BGX38DRAFT_1266487 [Terfezia claveryi]|nr:hypothetical protein BGX38DRAFT_1266487 [Terfezia claveryi]